ncbi:MAG: lipid A-modifier LpxR family protein, partial [Bacteroidota bacterium]
MKTLARVCSPFLVLILSLTSIFSQQVAHDIYFPTELYPLGKESFFIYLDNDKFIPPSLDEDRDYTNGIAFSYSNKSLLNFPLHKINNWLLNRVLNPQTDSNFQFLSPEIKLASLAYTPRDIAESRLILDDRPYASVHYLEIKSRLWNRQKNQVHSLGISYGVLASPIAEFAQRIIHTIGRIRPIPEGWDNQIAHPWEPTLLMSYQRDRLWSKDKARSFSDLKESISFEVGFRMMASYALTGRIGTKLGKRDQGLAFLFLRIKPHVLAYDANL